ncbi:MAG: SDR family oxidoreductase [Cyanobacteria bacterium]|nr:SDR family oxidoreductase [Cyanobacteria bacterium GSL.Bin21]
MTKRLENKIALITGGTTGIGFETAKAYLSAGAKVAITGNNVERLDQAQALLGKNVTTYQANVLDLDQINSLVNSLQKDFGTVDIAFINAGVARLAPFLETDEATFDANMNTNFKGAYFTLQKLVPLLSEGASVIMNTSVNAQMGMKMSSSYAASKAALRSLVRVAASELAEKKIRVNAVSPGPVQTPIYSKMNFPQEMMEGFAASLQKQIPMGRFGNPEEIAQVALFLASDDSSFMTGEEVTVDGGWTEVVAA